MRRAKAIEDVLRDPRGLFHVGQLIGASEMASHQLQASEDPRAKAIGTKLAEATGWFFIGEEVDKWDKPPTLPPQQKP